MLCNLFSVTVNLIDGTQWHFGVMFFTGTEKQFLISCLVELSSSILLNYCSCIWKCFSPSSWLSLLSYISWYCHYIVVCMCFLEQSNRIYCQALLLTYSFCSCSVSSSPLSAVTTLLENSAPATGNYPEGRASLTSTRWVCVCVCVCKIFSSPDQWPGQQATHTHSYWTNIPFGFPSGTCFIKVNSS